MKRLENIDINVSNVTCTVFVAFAYAVVIVAVARWALAQGVLG